MPQIIELTHEWDARHGAATDPPIPDQKWNLLFADGAWRTWDDRFREEPPQGKRRLLDMRRKYHDAWKTLLTNNFNALRAHLHGQTENYVWPRNIFGPPPPPQQGLNANEAALTWLVQCVHKHEIALAAIDAEIAALPEEVARREREENLRLWEEERRARAAEELARIEAITLD